MIDEYYLETDFVNERSIKAKVYIPSSDKTEEDLIYGLIYIWTEGNYSCDCNKKLFITRFYDGEEDEDWDHACGHTILLKQLTLIKPDKTKQVIWSLVSTGND